MLVGFENMECVTENFEGRTMWFGWLTERWLVSRKILSLLSEQFSLYSTGPKQLWAFKRILAAACIQLPSVLVQAAMWFFYCII